MRKVISTAYSCSEPLSLLILAVHCRFSSGANTTRTTLNLLPMTQAPMNLAGARPRSANGTRNSLLLTKRCSSRLFLQQTISTSRHFCELTLQFFDCTLSILTLTTRSDVGCKTVANMIKGKTPEEIRKTFNIHNDFTPEEEVCGTVWLT